MSLTANKSSNSTELLNLFPEEMQQRFLGVFVGWVFFCELIFLMAKLFFKPECHNLIRGEAFITTCKQGENGIFLAILFQKRDGTGNADAALIVPKAASTRRE